VPKKQIFTKGRERRGLFITRTVEKRKRLRKRRTSELPARWGQALFPKKKKGWKNQLESRPGLKLEGEERKKKALSGSSEDHISADNGPPDREIGPQTHPLSTEGRVQKWGGRIISGQKV